MSRKFEEIIYHKVHKGKIFTTKSTKIFSRITKNFCMVETLASTKRLFLAKLIVVEEVNKLHSEFIRVREVE